MMADAQSDVTSDRREAAGATGPGAPDLTTGDWPVVASIAREGLVANAWRRNVAVSYYIGPPRDRSCGRPCPRCLEPGSSFRPLMLAGAGRIARWRAHGGRPLGRRGVLVASPRRRALARARRIRGSSALPPVAAVSA